MGELRLGWLSSLTDNVEVTGSNLTDIWNGCVSYLIKKFKKRKIDQNSGSSGVVLKEDSCLLAMLQILPKILPGWTMIHVPPWVLPHIILSIDGSWWVFTCYSDFGLETTYLIWNLSMIFGGVDIIMLVVKLYFYYYARLSLYLFCTYARFEP